MSFRRYGIVVVTSLVLLGHWAQPSRAADPAGYVSDSFKKVARRLADQAGTQLLDKACPDSKPLCASIVVHLKSALIAVIAHDDDGVRGSLKQLFLDGSVAGLVQVSVADLFDATNVPSLQPLAPWIQRCVMAAVSGKPTRNACLPMGSERAGVIALISTCTNSFPVPFCEPVQTLLDRVQNGKAIDPALAIRAFARLMMFPGIDRPDVGIYLERVADFTAHGVDGGLFVATWAFLLSAAPTSDGLLTAATGDLLAYPAITTAVMTSHDDAAITADIVACKRPSTRFDAWKAGRDEFFTSARAAYFAGAKVNWEVLDALAAYDGCAGKDLRAFLRGTRFFAAPLKIAQTLERTAVSALAVSELIDYIRSADEAVVEKRAIQLLSYAVASLGARRLNVRDFAANKITRLDQLVSAERGLRSCEVVLLLRFSHVELPGASTPPTAPVDGKHCFSLLAGKDVDMATLGSDALGKAREALMLDTPGSFTLLNDVPVDMVQRALSQLASGGPAGSSKVVLRIGIDYLVEQVDQLAVKLVGDVAKCETLIGHRFIWQEVDAGCTAHILISVAYKAIADYFWTEGANGGDSAKIGREVYSKLLASPAISSLPIILNVGLGGNYIRGIGTDFWGHDGYGAATVIDKLGLAIYRRVSKDTRFEVGPFAGGFLDAIVRTAADEGTAQRSWLLGVTAGWPRINGLDIGFELHAAAVMPFEFSADRYGYAIGAALVIPFNFVLEHN